MAAASCATTLTVRPQLRQALTDRVANGPRTVDMMNWMTRVALELIGQGGLGYSFDPLVTDSANPWGEAMKNLM